MPACFEAMTDAAADFSPRRTASPPGCGYRRLDASALIYGRHKRCARFIAPSSRQAPISAKSHDDACPLFCHAAKRPYLPPNMMLTKIAPRPQEALLRDFDISAA